MLKEEKLKIIKELNDCFNGVVESYLERLEKAEDKEAKACDGEKDYSQEATVNERN